MQLLTKGVPFATPPRSPQHRSCISPRYGQPLQPLQEVLLVSWFSCHLMETSPNVIHEVQCCLVQHTRGLHCKWYRGDGSLWGGNTYQSSDVHLVQPLLQLLWLQQRYVRAQKCPGKWHPTPTPSRLPRQNGVVFIRGLPICPAQPLVSTGRKPWLKSIPSGRCSSQLHGGNVSLRIHWNGNWGHVLPDPPPCASSMYPSAGVMEVSNMPNICNSCALPLRY